MKRFLFLLLLAAFPLRAETLSLLMGVGVYHPSSSPYRLLYGSYQPRFFLGAERRVSPSVRLFLHLQGGKKRGTSAPEEPLFPEEGFPLEVQTLTVALGLGGVIPFPGGGRLFFGAAPLYGWVEERGMDEEKRLKGWGWTARLRGEYPFVSRLALFLQGSWVGLSPKGEGRRIECGGAALEAGLRLNL